MADSGKKVELRTGRKLKIISIGNELKFCHDFDRNEYEDVINGIIYYDYLCEFTLDGKKYKGNVPGVYVSTSVKELVVGDGAKYFTEYELLSLTFASGQLFFRDLLTCNSFEEVNIGIKNKLHDYMFFEEFHMNQKRRESCS
ncbi:MAG: hypothetical protein ACI4MA_00130 [Treponema sp.]